MSSFSTRGSLALLHGGMQSGPSLCPLGKLLPSGLPRACSLPSQAPALQPQAGGGIGTQSSRSRGPCTAGQARRGGSGQRWTLHRALWKATMVLLDGGTFFMPPFSRLTESGPAARGLWRGVCPGGRENPKPNACLLCFRCGVHQGRKNADIFPFCGPSSPFYMLFFLPGFPFPLHSFPHSLTNPSHLSAWSYTA